MKKSILHIGEALDKSAQKNVYGGGPLSASDCLANGCPSNEICTQIFHDPDGGGPMGEQSQWICIDPVNHK